MKRLYDLNYDNNLAYDPEKRRGNIEISLNFFISPKKQKSLNTKPNKGEKLEKRVKKEK